MNNELYIRKSEDTWTRLRSFPTYREAVIEGQSTGFPFMIDTGSRIPSREEQLLEPIKPKTKSKKQRILDSI